MLALLAALALAAEPRTPSPPVPVSVSVMMTAYVVEPLELTAADLASAPEGAAFVTVYRNEDGARVVSYEDEHGFPWEPPELDQAPPLLALKRGWPEGDEP